jgi:hypothetical protein
MYLKNIKTFGMELPDTLIGLIYFIGQNDHYVLTGTIYVLMIGR